MSFMRGGSVLGVVLGFAGAAFATPPVPRPSEQFTLTDTSGKPISFSNYAGKVVLVQFLYTTCPHCQMTSRTFARLQSELGSRGLQVVGVAFNEEAEGHTDVARAYAEANGVNFPLGVSTRVDVLKYLGISVISRFAVPQVVVIDRNGVIRAQSEPLGSEALMNETQLRPLLEKLLDEHAGVKLRSRR